jgi:hypothetical protein
MMVPMGKDLQVVLLPILVFLLYNLAYPLLSRIVLSASMRSCLLFSIRLHTFNPCRTSLKFTPLNGVKALQKAVRPLSFNGNLGTPNPELVPKSLL